ncbi:MAG: hypothetical protein DBX47_00195 [Clostridiales bacterium]|nr:MAG: hypothetical protein DBX47_00195 [Clostridiales bacterium]
MKINTPQTATLQFESDNGILEQGFVWAKKQAMEFVHNGNDKVGLWYEAALPEREAFCIRDVSHQRFGAAVLGLGLHTKNMLKAFARSISVNRDYCMFWEINKDNLPAPVDYTNDKNFWYNLPANFDMLWACWQEYLWTKDPDYLNDPEMLNFYELTCTEYVSRWDKDGDGILEYYPQNGCRGIASYNEVGQSPYFAADMIGAQYAGFIAYANILKCQGETEKANVFCEKAAVLKNLYLEDWYNSEEKRFYGAKITKDSFADFYWAEGHFLPLYFGILSNNSKSGNALTYILENGVSNVEGKSYLPRIYYQYGAVKEAYKHLTELCEPTLNRREYPEVSFSFLGVLINQYMGIQAGVDYDFCTLPQLVNKKEKSSLKHLPVGGGFADVSHVGNNFTKVKNLGGKEIQWQAAFYGDFKFLYVDGSMINAQKETDETGRVYSFVKVNLKPGITASVCY